MGEIQEKEHNFICNYSNGENEICDFMIWKDFYEKKIDINMVSQLLAYKTTDVWSDFISQKTGKPFSATIIINEHFKADLNFLNHNDILEDIECVGCGGKIYEGSSGYYCEGRIEQSCNMLIPKVAAYKELRPDDVITLIKGNKPILLKVLKQKTKGEF